MTVPQRIATFYSELKRRKVFRTAVAYSVAAAAIIQLTDPVASALSLPALTLTVVVIAAVAGLPVAIILAWLFDVRRDHTETLATPAPAEAQSARAPSYRIAAPHTPLVGRAGEMAEAITLLSGTRLLTITGPGGIGKTRLSVEIGNCARQDYADGVCVVTLAGVEDVDALPGALADAFGFTLTSRESPLKQLSGFLEEKQLLIVMDNFEQIVDGGSLVAELMASAPRVRFLVTSRRRLRIAGETVFNLDVLSESDATNLFVQVAQRSDPRFRPSDADSADIARICRVLDGIPLAIELAAASAGVLTCAEIAHEIEQNHGMMASARRDLPPRHQSLSAAFESSWRLLDEEERRVCRRLSVFRSGFDRDTAAAVGAADLRLIVRLAEVSLLHRPALGRFHMLEVIRQFAGEKLDADAEESTLMKRAHAEYFLRRVASLSEQDIVRRKELVDGLVEWINDVTAAWSWAVHAFDVASLSAAGPGMYLLLEARGRGVEGMELFQRAAAMARLQDASGSLLVPLLTRHAAFLFDCGRIPEATTLLDEAVATLHSGDDAAELAFALSRRCSIALATGDFQSGAFEECLALYRALDDKRGIAWALNAFGGAKHASGDYDAAKRLYAESIALFRSIGLEDEAWPAINNSAGIAQLEKNYAAAREILEKALESFSKRNNPRALSFLLNNLGYVIYLTGDYERAREILAQGIALARSMGYRGRLAYSLNTLALLEAGQGNSEASARTLREALAVAVSAGETTLAATILVGIARDLCGRNEFARAASMLAAVENHPGCDLETRTAARTLKESLGAMEVAEVTSFEEAVRGAVSVSA